MSGCMMCRWMDGEDGVNDCTIGIEGTCIPVDDRDV